MTEAVLEVRMRLQHELLAVAQQLTELELLLQDYRAERAQLLAQARLLRAQLETLQFESLPLEENL